MIYAAVPSMNSCFYECQMMHRRSTPRVHEFAYRIFLFALDLDELDMVQRKIGIFSVNQRNVYSFRDRDYLPTQEPLHNSADRSPIKFPSADFSPGDAGGSQLPLAPATVLTLKQRVVAFAHSRGVNLTGGRIVLVTLPRIFGTLFNPVSFFFCYDRTGEPVAALAEVTNTFREMKPFFLGPSTKTASGIQDSAPEILARPGTAQRTSMFRLRVPKNFYVSPFSDIDVEFDFKLSAPGERLTAQIDDYAAGTRTFQSTLKGRREELTSARLAWYTIKYPLITLRIITLIHWHAFLLWTKKIPWFAKAARGPEQRDLYRAHTSLTKQRQPAAIRHAAAPPPVLDPIPARKSV